jgi:hypothetical protein
MSKKKTTPEYQSFKEFYLQQVIPYKKTFPTHIRLDGKINESSQRISAYFWYLGQKWKIDFDRLKTAFDEFEKSETPLIIRPTKNNKSKCLIIKDQPLRNKKFYVYQVGK